MANFGDICERLDWLLSVVARSGKWKHHACHVDLVISIVGSYSVKFGRIDTSEGCVFCMEELLSRSQLLLAYCFVGVVDTWTHIGGVGLPLLGHTHGWRRLDCFANDGWLRGGLQVFRKGIDQTSRVIKHSEPVSLSFRSRQVLRDFGEPASLPLPGFLNHHTGEHTPLLYQRIQVETWVTLHQDPLWCDEGWLNPA